MILSTLRNSLQTLHLSISLDSSYGYLTSLGHGSLSTALLAIITRSLAKGSERITPTVVFMIVMVTTFWSFSATAAQTIGQIL
jgi:hypothetical protein